MRFFACADPLIMLLSQPNDDGPVYAETNMDRFVVEPFNAATALLFLLIVIYWAYRLKGRFRKHKFISLCLPVLATGGIGGTIYHAFRLSPFFLYMDYLPIVFLAVAASFYFWRKVLRKKWQLYLVFSAFLGIGLAARISLHFYATGDVRLYLINIVYALLGLMIVIPLFLLLNKTSWRFGGVAIWAMVCFGLALLFRSVDKFAWFAFGTHWLWHVFGALACSMLIEYVYRLRAVWRVMYPQPFGRQEPPAVQRMSA